jgi:hypothetical protein
VARVLLLYQLGSFPLCRQAAPLNALSFLRRRRPNANRDAAAAAGQFPVPIQLKSMIFD